LIWERCGEAEMIKGKSGEKIALKYLEIDKIIHEIKLKPKNMY